MKTLKIKSIKKKCLDNPVPVYDIEVEKNHNFALYNGAVVHNCEPYAYFKNTIYEQRISLYKDCDWLTEEISSLERNINSGKVDHPENGHKDASDAVCGAIWNASQHAEEFAFEYGEDIDNMTAVSNTPSESEVKKQIQVDFEEELKRAFSTPIVPQSMTTIPQPNMNAFYLSQGIII